jgi:hypothetical protein
MEYFIDAKTLHVRDPEPATVRVATCPERDVLLDCGVAFGLVDKSFSVELTPSKAREVAIKLIEIAATVEARKNS